MPPISSMNTRVFIENFEKNKPSINIYNLMPRFNQPEWSYFQDKSLTDILMKSGGPVLLSDIYNSAQSQQDLKCVLALADAFSLKDHEIRSLVDEIRQLPASQKNMAFIINSETIKTKMADIREEQKKQDIESFKTRHAPLKSKMDQFIAPNGPLSRLKPQPPITNTAFNRMRQQIVDSYKNGTPIPHDNTLKDSVIEGDLTIQKAYDQYYDSMARMMPKPRVSKIHQEAMDNFDTLDEISQSPRFQRKVFAPVKDQTAKRPLPIPVSANKADPSKPPAYKRQLPPLGSPKKPEPSKPPLNIGNSQKAKADATYRAAFAHFYGKGAPKDIKKAIELLKQAAKDGSGKAQNMLGHCYSTGFGGIKPDLKWAIYYYKQAAQSGNPEAQFRLALAFILGRGVAKNINEAYKLLNLSAKAGNAKAQNTLGLILYYGDEGININHKMAFDLFKQAALKGNTQAQTHLGLCYFKAQGVNQNLSEAIQLFKVAASKNDPMAQTQLAVCYYNGTGVKKNVPEAIRLLKLAADNSYSDAIEFLDEIQNS